MLSTAPSISPSRSPLPSPSRKLDNHWLDADHDYDHELVHEQLHDPWFHPHSLPLPHLHPPRSPSFSSSATTRSYGSGSGSGMGLTANGSIVAGTGGVLGNASGTPVSERPSMHAHRHSSRLSESGLGYGVTTIGGSSGGSGFVGGSLGGGGSGDVGAVNEPAPTSPGGRPPVGGRSNGSSRSSSGLGYGVTSIGRGFDWDAPSALEECDDGGETTVRPPATRHWTEASPDPNEYKRHGGEGDALVRGVYSAFGSVTMGRSGGGGGGGESSNSTSAQDGLDPGGSCSNHKETLEEDKDKEDTRTTPVQFSASTLSSSPPSTTMMDSSSVPFPASSTSSSSSSTTTSTSMPPPPVPQRHTSTGTGTGTEQYPSVFHDSPLPSRSHSPSPFAYEHTQSTLPTSRSQSSFSSQRLNHTSTHSGGGGGGGGGAPTRPSITTSLTTPSAHIPFPSLTRTPTSSRPSSSQHGLNSALSSSSSFSFSSGYPPHPYPPRTPTSTSTSAHPHAQARGRISRRSSQQRVSLIAGRVSIAPYEHPDDLARERDYEGVFDGLMMTRVSERLAGSRNLDIDRSPIAGGGGGVGGGLGEGDEVIEGPGLKRSYLPASLARTGSSSSYLSKATTTRPPSPSSTFNSNSNFNSSTTHSRTESKHSSEGSGSESTSTVSVNGDADDKAKTHTHAHKHHYQHQHHHNHHHHHHTHSQGGVLGTKRIEDYVIEADLGRGAYGLVKRAREILKEVPPVITNGVDGEGRRESGEDTTPTVSAERTPSPSPQDTSEDTSSLSTTTPPSSSHPPSSSPHPTLGPPVVIKYVIKQRILADCWKRHPVYGTIPIEIYVMAAISGTEYVLPQRRGWDPRRFEDPDPDSSALVDGQGKGEGGEEGEGGGGEGEYGFDWRWREGATVKGHPNICPLLDFFEDDHYYYLVLPCSTPPPPPPPPPSSSNPPSPHPNGDAGYVIPGSTPAPSGPPSDLFDLVEVYPRGLPARDVRSYLGQLADAVGFLHGLGIVHRDLKDENVVLGANGRCILIDFGSSGLVKKGGWDTFSGTLDYAAPEILRGEKYQGKEQDVWAFGVVAYVLLVGECPFSNKEEAMEGLGSVFCAAGVELDERCSTEEEDLPDTNTDHVEGKGEEGGSGDGGEEDEEKSRRRRLGEERDGGGYLPDAAALVKACLDVDVAARPTFEKIMGSRFLAGEGGWV